MSEQTGRPVPDLPAAESCRLIEFERAEVVSVMMEPAHPVLVVSGRKQWANMRVELVPLRYYHVPEYQGIEVVGCMPQIGQPAIVPYVVELDLTGICGQQGIEVIGANKTEQIQLSPTGSAESTVGQVEDGAFQVLYPPSVHEGPVRLTTVGVKDDARPETGQIDLRPLEGSILRVQGVLDQGWIRSAVITERVPDSILAVLVRQMFPVPKH